MDFDEKLSNWSTSFITNSDNVSITNLTIEPFQTITKFLVYMKISLAEGENDRECKREFVRTVFDAEKATAGEQKNLIVRGFVGSLRKYMDFDFKMPLPPV